MAEKPTKTPDDRARTKHAHAEPKWESLRRGEKLAEKLAQLIVDDIDKRELQPGDKLDAEADMIQNYRVSRGSLREALRVLEMHGIIVMKPGPGGGPVLRQIGVSDFARVAKLHLHMRKSTYREVLAARLAIEPMMAKLAADMRDPEAYEELRRVVENGAAMMDADEEIWREAQQDFHATVAGMSGNSVLDLLGAALKEVYVTRPRAVASMSVRAKVQDVHQQIADAIFAGESEVAERLMREHMEEVAQKTDAADSCGLDARLRWP